MNASTLPFLCNTGMDVVDEDWEEWDRASPFWHHMLAGSAAGVMEHTVMFPVDSYKVCVWGCAGPDRFGDLALLAGRCPAL